MIEFRKNVKSDPYTHKMASDKITEFLKEAKKMKNGLQGQNYQSKNVSQILGFKIPSGNKNTSLVNNNSDPETLKYREQISNAILCIRPSTTWDSVAGLEHAKNTLKEAIHLPLRHPQIFEGVLTPWKGNFIIFK